MKYGDRKRKKRMIKGEGNEDGKRKGDSVWKKKE